VTPRRILVFMTTRALHVNEGFFPNLSLWWGPDLYGFRIAIGRLGERMLAFSRTWQRTEAE